MATISILYILYILVVVDNRDVRMASSRDQQIKTRVARFFCGFHLLSCKPNNPLYQFGMKGGRQREGRRQSSNKLLV